MDASTLRVGNNEYHLVKVHVRQVTHEKIGEKDFITFDLFADVKKLTRAGFAINAITVMGANVADLENLEFELKEDSEDELNELRESVIGIPNQQFELSSLKLKFGTISNRTIQIQLEAICFRLDDQYEVAESGIPVTGQFNAELHV